jgi:hypothetical protein
VEEASKNLTKSPHTEKSAFGDLPLKAIFNIQPNKNVFLIFFISFPVPDPKIGKARNSSE